MQIEVGLFGREGMSALAVVMGNDRSPFAIFMQAPGRGFRIPSTALRDAMETSASLRDLLTHYAQAFAVQTAYTALANGQCDLDERLCRWLLMCQDRLGDDLPLTHDLLALMLGVRRAGVTEAVHTLEAQGMIEASRGHLRVIDRAGLRQTARGLYGVPESEFRRLTGCRDPNEGRLEEVAA